MEFQFPAINYLYLVAFLTAACLAIFSLNQAKNYGGRLWLAVMISFTIWPLGELLANSGTTLAWQLGFQRIVYLGVICAVTSWLLFAIHYAGYDRWLNRSLMALIMVVPLSSLVMVMTLDMHALLYTRADLIMRDGYYVLDLDYGVGFWLQIIASSYLYTLAGSALLLYTSFGRPRIYQAQSVLIGLAALMPVIPNMLYVAGLDIAGGFDPTSLFFVISAVLVTLATQQYHFLTLAPVARDLVFENVNIAVVIATSDDKISDVNPAFSEITGETAGQLIGEPLLDVFKRGFDGEELTRAASHWQGRLVSRRDGRLFDISSMPVTGQYKEKLGYLVLLNDVTLVQKALDEIDRLAGGDLLRDKWQRSELQLDLPEIDDP